VASLPGARRDLDRETTAALVNRLFWDLLTDPQALTEAHFEQTMTALIAMLNHILFEGVAT